ncbi:hypothetical protein [Haladaptatus sp. CMAA 1911]|uniref:hypothetical protein n=2 Tax=unclassified Haladaptatus TaxID=2622732 RepID=UPI0037545115
MGSSRTVRISRVDQPIDSRATVSAKMITANITEKSTAVVEIGLEWTGEATALLFGNTAPIELPCRCSRPETGLVLLPSPNGYERREDEPECWKPNLPEDDDFGHPLGLMRREVERGELLSCRVEIWGDHRSKSCLEPGEYSFRETLSVENEGHNEWGFTIRIEN